MAAAVQLPTRRPTAASQAARDDAPFDSILFDGPDAPRALCAAEPDSFRDLGLDQIVAAVAAPWNDHDVAAFFRVSLTQVDAVAYRQEVMGELERPEIMAAVRGFTQRLRALRQQLPLATKCHNAHERHRWFLESVRLYGEAIETQRRELAPLPLHSRGLRRWRNYLDGYAESPGFTRLMAQVRRLLGDLSAIRYALRIHGDSVVVRAYDGAPDYAAQVERTFAKFRRGAVKDYLAKLPVTVG